MTGAAFDALSMGAMNMGSDHQGEACVADGEVLSPAVPIDCPGVAPARVDRGGRLRGRSAFFSMKPLKVVTVFVQSLLCVFSLRWGALGSQRLRPSTRWDVGRDEGVREMCDAVRALAIHGRAWRGFRVTVMERVQLPLLCHPPRNLS